jgi:hypothetical protein
MTQNNTIKLLALIIGASLILSVTLSTSAFAEEKKDKKKDTKKDTKKESKKDSKKDKKKLIKQTIKKPKTMKTSAVSSNATTTNIAAKLQPTQMQTVDDALQDKLQACKQKETQREQYECEKALKSGNVNEEFKSKSTKTVIGPITFYYAGATVEKTGGKDIVNLKFLVENTGSKENIALYCTGPAACNYDVSDGTTTYKYSAQDFTNGQIVLKPGASRMFNMLFGPAIGYGSYIDFKFDPSKQYTFNIKESWGSGNIPLNLK